jgi:hypothetical protein
MVYPSLITSDDAIQKNIYLFCRGTAPDRRGSDAHTIAHGAHQPIRSELNQVQTA